MNFSIPNVDHLCRYHAMDCLSLLEYSGGVKSLHIPNATQLFTFNQIYGLHFWSEIALLHCYAREDFKKTVDLLTAIYHSNNTQRQLFADEGDLHLCESPAEFLLEPWLLMQVPWHPAVYNQWLAAALAEVLMAKKQLVEFYWWPVPRKLCSVISTLLSQMETLHRRLISGFGLINWLSNLNGKSGHGFETNHDTMLVVLNQVILPSVPIIEFLVGDKFEIVAKALKRMAWPSEGNLTAEEELIAICCSDKISDLLPMYSLNFHQLGCPVFMFGKLESLEGFQEVKDELAMLPCKIDFVPIKSAYEKVSYLIKQQFLARFGLFSV